MSDPIELSHRAVQALRDHGRAITKGFYYRLVSDNLPGRPDLVLVEDNFDMPVLYYRDMFRFVGPDEEICEF